MISTLNTRANWRNCRPASRRQRSYAEPLEARQLLSTSLPVMHSDAIRVPSAASTSASEIQGYSPDQIRTAYGFDQVSLPGGAAAEGSGQTIAIVDAYNDPKIDTDLATFDTQFGLGSPPSLRVVNQKGGTTLPTTDGGWAGEIALDVEWAHAIAPGASILLVEANSSSISDLMTAVNYARNAAGVSVVSMSWGGSEFFSWNGGEFTGQTQYDAYFTTPAGHQGVTFVAAAGDSGAYGGVQWPASSPNVLSVGGTSLYVGNNSGSYYLEQSWDGTSGGFSQVEAEPAYQANVQDTGVRTTPDVAYNADPNTGFAIYDSVPYQGTSGWQVVGGTSAGAPQWAALVATADQQRAQANQGTLDGPAQTLPALYGLYVSPDGPTYSQYTSDFNDVIDGGGGHGGWRWRWGAFGFSNPATQGYDTSTGLGTPKASAVVSALAATTLTNTGGDNGTGSLGGSGNGTNAFLPAAQLSVAFTSVAKPSVIGGAAGVLHLRVTNQGSTRFSGPVSVDLYAGTTSATDSTTLAGDAHITQAVLPDVELGAGKSQIVTVRYSYPATVSSGSYYLLVSLNEMGLNVAPASVASARTVQISPATVDLATTFASAEPVFIRAGHATSVVVTVQNLGNVAAVGTANLTLYASANGTLNPTIDPLLASLSGRAINIPPGRSIRVRLSFQSPSNLTPGAYSLIADLVSATNPADANSTNDMSTIATRA